MNIYKKAYQGTIRIKKNSFAPYIYDIDLVDLNDIKSFDSFECHAVLYPYSRKTSSDNFVFEPFEEYAKDILSNQRSVYFKIADNFSKYFGGLLLALLSLLLSIFKPFAFFSIEYLVSLMWAYLIGKEIGEDVERMLLDLTKKWRIRLIDNYYSYELERGATLTNYSRLARERRHGKISLMPLKFDFIKQSNSQTVRMCFDRDNITEIKESQANLFSVRFDNSLLSDFEKSGYMFGLKLSFNKHFLGIKRGFEIFQSVDIDKKGCLNEGGKWIDKAIFYRNTYTLGRIKYYKNDGILNNEVIFE